MRTGNQETFRGQTALITGASSGIGAATARLFASHGIKVILVARRVDRLEALAAEIIASGGEALVLPADLSEPGGRKTLASYADQTDILINNAGFGWYGYFSDMPEKLVDEMLQVNLIAVAELTRMFLPSMRQRKNGHIINISSVVGGLPEQGVALYASTKAFMDSFTTALHRELRGSGVHISVLRPGPVKSEFYPRALAQQNGRRVPAERFAVSSEHVAEAIWSLLLHPRRVVYVPGWLRISRLLEPIFGGFIDKLGPLLLRSSD